MFTSTFLVPKESYLYIVLSNANTLLKNLFDPLIITGATTLAIMNMGIMAMKGYSRSPEL